MFEYWREELVIVLALFTLGVPLVFMLTAAISVGWNAGKAGLIKAETERMRTIVEFSKLQAEKEKEEHGKE